MSVFDDMEHDTNVFFKQFDDFVEKLREENAVQTQTDEEWFEEELAKLRGKHISLKQSLADGIINA